MAHRSWVRRESAASRSNERLEFLGDAVLGWVVADIAFRQFTELPEGALTDLRKSVVNAAALAEVAEELGIGEALLLGKGEDAAGGREKPSILSDALEAVLGAVYVDGGTAVAYALIERLVGAAPRQPPSTASTSSTTSRACRRPPPATVFGAARVRRARRGSRPRQEVLRHGRARRPHHRRGRGPFEEGGRADGRVRGVRPARRRLTVRPATPILNVACQSCPRSRRSGAGSTALVVGRRIDRVEVGRAAHRAAHVARRRSSTA